MEPTQTTAVFNPEQENPLLKAGLGIRAPIGALPPEIEEAQQRIEKIAREKYGLDFDPIVYIMVDRDGMCEAAAYGGLPVRYPHWRFGMQYEELKKGHDWGLQKIYEMVINNRPVYGYLQLGNTLLDQKLVMAHVCGHADFFKHNIYFAGTNKNAVNDFANHGKRIEQYMEKYGRDVVEDFIDAALSIEDLIDPHSLYIQRRDPVGKKPLSTEEEEDEQVQPGRFAAKNYMDGFINPKDVLERERLELQEQKKKAERLPEHPERDVLRFITENTEFLKPWQLAILDIVREEAYYFVPQGQTKIMNEGWAVYWHTHIMNEQICTDADFLDHADHTSGTLASNPTRLNPYTLGYKLFLDIKERWDKGRHGQEYDECEDLDRKRNWDTKEMKGLEEIFRARKIHSDVTFIDTYLTLEFCKENKFFQFGYNKNSENWEIESKQFEQIKQTLLDNLTNHGRPAIYVTDGNFRNRGELLLVHQAQGMTLDQRYSSDTLKGIYRLWGRPVHIETINDEGTGWIRISFDGTNVSTEKIKEDPVQRYFSKPAQS